MTPPPPYRFFLEKFTPISPPSCLPLLIIHFRTEDSYKEFVIKKIKQKAFFSNNENTEAQRTLRKLDQIVR